MDADYPLMIMFVVFVLLILLKPRQSLKQPEIRECLNVVEQEQLVAILGGPDFKIPKVYEHAQQIQFVNLSCSVIYNRTENKNGNGNIAEIIDIYIFRPHGRGTTSITWFNGEVKLWSYSDRELPSMSVSENFMAYRILKDVRAAYQSVIEEFRDESPNNQPTR